MNILNTSEMCGKTVDEDDLNLLNDNFAACDDFLGPCGLNHANNTAVTQYGTCLNSKYVVHFFCSRVNVIILAILRPLHSTWVERLAQVTAQSASTLIEIVQTLFINSSPAVANISLLAAR